VLPWVPNKHFTDYNFKCHLWSFWGISWCHQDLLNSGQEHEEVNTTHVWYYHEFSWRTTRGEISNAICEIFEETTGATKVYSMVLKKMKWCSIQYMFGITICSLQALHKTHLLMTFVKYLGELLVPPNFNQWWSITWRHDEYKTWLVLSWVPNK
jgi:hypothetical protein